MRILTHSFFSFGVAMLYLTYIGHPFEGHILSYLNVPNPNFLIFGVNPIFVLIDILICIPLAWLLNAFIDIAGHRKAGKYDRRSWRTHHFLMGPFWGAVIPSAIIAVPIWIIICYFVLTTTTIPQWFLMELPPLVEPGIWASAIGVLIASEHLFLDAFTPDGIYYTKYKDLKIARVSYASWSVNHFLVGLGLLYFALSLLYYELIKYSVVIYGVHLNLFQAVFLATVVVFYIVFFFADRKGRYDEKKAAEEEERKKALLKEAGLKPGDFR